MKILKKKNFRKFLNCLLSIKISKFCDKFLKKKILFDQKNYYSKYIELRSDVKTLPEINSLKNVFNLHDNSYLNKNKNENFFTNTLLNKICNIFKKESALICPTGRMANLIGILLNISRDDYFIIGKNSHIFLKEIDSIKLLGLNPIITSKIDPINEEASNYEKNQFRNKNSFEDFDIENIIKLERQKIQTQENYSLLKIEEKINKLENINLVCFENSHIYNGGILINMEYFNKNIVSLKKKFISGKGKKLVFHLDGSRILNASVASNTYPNVLTNDFDSVNLCLSKGLGSPIGSVLLIKNKDYDRARKMREFLGGDLISTEVLSILALEGIDNNYDRFQEDLKKQKF